MFFLFLLYIFSMLYVASMLLFYVYSKFINVNSLVCYFTSVGLDPGYIAAFFSSPEALLNNFSKLAFATLPWITHLAFSFSFH